mmetsp:Transcript_18627/g.45800  ORF Transcript_18627/g.45800 Transcript_18627/m.45800 type:complete len:222 (-) Transcript_18627:581-1246(-)
MPVWLRIRRVRLCLVSASTVPKLSTHGAPVSGPSSSGGQSVRTPTLSAAGVPLISSGTLGTVSSVPIWYVTARPMTLARSSKPVGAGMPSTSRGTRASMIPGRDTLPSSPGRSSSSSPSPRVRASTTKSTAMVSSGPSSSSTTLNEMLNTGPPARESGPACADAQEKRVRGRRVVLRRKMRRVTGTLRKIVPRSISRSLTRTHGYTTSARYEMKRGWPPSI